MEKKLFSLLFSTRLMAFLFVLFAAAMGIGTFIESEYNTDTARVFIYNAWWFETIMVFFIINFIGNIKRYQLYKLKNWATLTLHLSFILIIVGAYITRYISYEGMMPIREGATENSVYSDKVHLTAMVDGLYNGEMMRKTLEEPMILSPLASNHYSIDDKFDQIPFEITTNEYIMGATQTITPADKGDLYLKMVEAGGGGRHDHYLKEGVVENIHNILFAFNKETPGAVNIIKNEDGYFIRSPFGGSFMRMADQMQGQVFADSTQQLMLRSLYNVAGSQFVFPEPAMTGKVIYVGSNDYKTQGDDALKVTIKSGGQTEQLTLIGSKGKMGQPQAVKVGDLEFTLFFGSKVYTLPFGVKLNDFIAKKYPGTQKRYSAFESKVTILDSTETFDAHIYMNNILDYKGYRFFQASFDPDEKGTILSVNHDYWGTTITYIGYFLLYLGLMAILFDPNSRFGALKKKIEEVKKKKAALLIFLLLGLMGWSQNHDHNKPLTDAQIDSLVTALAIDADHAANFGRLVIQDAGGRMKPINTFASELVRKVSKSDHYKDLNADQVFLSITKNPRLWYSVPMIYLKRGNDSIRDLIGVDRKAKYAPLLAFFDERGQYKLEKLLEQAHQAPVPNQFQKDFIETDKKVNLLYSALTGSILKIFPIPFDENNKWISYAELSSSNIKGIDSMYVKNILPMYLGQIDTAQKEQNFSTVDTLVKSIVTFQKKYGSAVRPSDDKINAEIAYNKYDIFKRLYYLYMLVGSIMFILIIFKIFFDNKSFNLLVTTSHILIGVLFLLHTAGLIARWYISGHAPWSDAYESMIYVAWATMLFGLIYGKDSQLTVASTAFVTSMILMIAHWNWMDPSIANLQPVLNSYWLMIHVAVIVASYGPFTLGMILGIVALILMLLTNEKNKKKISLSIQEITYINESALTVGLVMLTIGNFLGGQWANESWGRYWGWDPKETWALISIMVYAFVIHMRLVPGLRGRWTFNFISIVAFASIMMTYFGVNFYLTGLHSYASGDKVVTPNFIYYSVVIVSALGIASYFKYLKYYKK
ncbi:MAG: cytochrome c biogenesis protein CcsA [Flavobacteriales bacterium]|nr:cytochrome c biogenesis protein CcsA [Flavobacteriales bacterium]